MIQQQNYMNKSFLLNLKDKNKKIPFEYGTRWMFFYIYCRFPLGLFLSLGTLINAFSELKETITYLTIMNFSLVLFQMAFIFFVYIQMRNRTIQGYYGNIIYLVVDVVLKTLFASYDTVFAELFFWSVWAVINFVYFHKRKIIFEKLDENTSIYQLAKTEETQIKNVNIDRSMLK